MVVSLGFSFGGFSTYMPSLFGTQTDGIFSLLSGSLKTGFFTTLVFLCGIAGQVLGGYFGDRYSRTHLLFVIIVLNIPFLTLIGYTKGWLLLLCSIVFGVVYFSNQPVSNALLADFTSNAHRGLGYGISFFLSFGMGGIAPAVCGWIAEAYTIEMVFPIMALCLLPGLLACIILIKQNNVQISLNKCISV
jgi:Major Facilitator Superfamily.